MEKIIEFLGSISTELVVGMSTFIIGYLTHIRGQQEAKNKVISERETRRLHTYELELETISKRQSNIQDYMEASIERLEKERDKLHERILKLQLQIDHLEKENLNWQMKYIDLLKKLPSDIESDVDYTI